MTAFTVTAIEFHERDVTLRMPFRFGVVTLTAAPQVFVRARVRLAGGGEAWGAGAELLAPKWFDKDPALTNEQNFDQLRSALTIARALYLDGQARSAFGHHAAHCRAQLEACAKRGLNRLVASFGPAQIDRALLDAFCRAHGISFYRAVREDRIGFAPGELAADLSALDAASFLAGLRPRDGIAARHTVGMVDPITGPGGQVGDGLPETLEQVIDTYGIAYFKLKVGGELKADLERLEAIAAVLDAKAGDYLATLDGNEQYTDAGAVVELVRRMHESPRLERLVDSILFIEQPIARKSALATDVRALAELHPVIIDESDDDLDAFPRALQLGYAGVSSKMCKGLYKSLINRARCSLAPGRLMSGEDLTTQAGLAVQQDLALVALLGLEHVERNGHHYVNGMAGAPASEQRAFARAHPDLYDDRSGTARLRIAGGQIAIGSLDCAGFASAAEPDWGALRPMAIPA